MNRSTAAAAFPLILIGLAIAGCADANRSARPPSKPAELAAVLAPANAAAEAFVELEPEAPVSRIPRSDQDQWIRRADLFDVGPLSVRSIRIEGAMFAASTQAAAPSQRPTAVLRVVRMRYTPRFQSSGQKEADVYSLEIEQRPGGRVAVGEAEARGLLEAIGNSAVAPTQPQPIISEVEFGKLRVVIDRERGDETRIETGKATATYGRASLAEKLVQALAMIDSLRGAPFKSE